MLCSNSDPTRVTNLNVCHKSSEQESSPRSGSDMSITKVSPRVPSAANPAIPTKRVSEVPPSADDKRKTSRTLWGKVRNWFSGRVERIMAGDSTLSLYLNGRRVKRILREGAGSYDSVNQIVYENPDIMVFKTALNSYYRQTKLHAKGKLAYKLCVEAQRAELQSMTTKRRFMGVGQNQACVEIFEEEFENGNDDEEEEESDDEEYVEDEEEDSDLYDEDSEIFANDEEVAEQERIEAEEARKEDELERSKNENEEFWTDELEKQNINEQETEEVQFKVEQQYPIMEHFQSPLYKDEILCEEQMVEKDKETEVFSEENYPPPLPADGENLAKVSVQLFAENEPEAMTQPVPIQQSAYFSSPVVPQEMMCDVKKSSSDSSSDISSVSEELETPNDTHNTAIFSNPNLYMDCPQQSEYLLFPQNQQRNSYPFFQSPSNHPPEFSQQLSSKAFSQSIPDKSDFPRSTTDIKPDPISQPKFTITSTRKSFHGIGTSSSFTRYSSPSVPQHNLKPSPMDSTQSHIHNVHMLFMDIKNKMDEDLCSPASSTGSLHFVNGRVDVRHYACSSTSSSRSSCSSRNSCAALTEPCPRVVNEDERPFNSVHSEGSISSECHQTGNTEAEYEGDTYTQDYTFDDTNSDHYG